jgi:hypothetical protein
VAKNLQHNNNGFECNNISGQDPQHNNNYGLASCNISGRESAKSQKLWNVPIATSVICNMTITMTCPVATDVAKNLQHYNNKKMQNNNKNLQHNNNKSLAYYISYG